MSEERDTKAVHSFIRREEEKGREKDREKKGQRK